MAAFSIKHDLHCHSILSLCAHDELMNFPTIVAFAEEHNYDTICLTNHFWGASTDVEGMCPFYDQQSLWHIRKALPKPHSDQVRVLFGCETEYGGGDKIGLKLDDLDQFDFIVIPLTHQHFKGLVRPLGVDTEEKMARLVVERMFEIQQLDLPFRKVGIAHPNCSLLFAEGSVPRVLELMDEDLLFKAYRGFAEKGVGIEINAFDCMAWHDDPQDVYLKQYRIAKAAGCKFYVASDAHSREDLLAIEKYCLAFIEAIGLTDDDRYTVPE